MGYQESFIHTNCSDVKKNNEDIKKYIEMFKKYDVRCEGDQLASCIVKLHFNRDINIYKKGMDILVISGERSAQRSAYRLFDIDDDYDMIPKYTDEELKLIKRAKITFIENAFDVLDAEKDGSSIDVEELSLTPTLPSNYNKVSNLFNEVFNNIIAYLNKNGESEIKKHSDLLCRYSPKNNLEVANIISIIKKVIESNEYNFECRQSKENVRTLDGDFLREDYSFYINNVCFGYICYLPWSNIYTFNLYNTTGQSLRDICKKLLDQENQECNQC